MVDLRDHLEGNYRFLATTAAAPFSAGVVAAPGHEVAHAVLHRPVPFRQGFDYAARYLAGLGRPRSALCAVELRGAAPYTPEQWTAPDGFNEQYRSLLRAWGVFVDGFCPVARTNVAPVVTPPGEQVLYGFSYTVPVQDASAGSPATFVASGAPEAADLRRAGVPLAERLSSATSAVAAALSGLGVAWADATAVSVYLAEPVPPAQIVALLAAVGPAATHGLRWFHSRPPLQGLSLEVDSRGVRYEVILHP